MDSSKTLHPLDASLHDFCPSMFGMVEDLKHLQPNSDGWSAVMVCCSEFGFGPDQNSIFEIGELFIVQNFGNVIIRSSDEQVVTEITQVLIEKQLTDLIVFGHVGCRTIEHFLWEDRDNEWLKQGDELREFMKQHYGNVNAEQKLNIAAQENVLIQLETEILSLSQLELDARLYGWLNIGLDNQIMQYDPRSGQFS